MQESKISWTTVTWNPTFGCSRISEGCRFCYAESLALKFKLSDSPWTAKNAAHNVVLKEHKLREPYRLKEPSRIFVNSMSDLFHEKIPDSYLERIFEVMTDLPQHTFQILTKRPDRAAQWKGPWPENIWMGTTVEDTRVVDRISHLKKCKAAIKFISAEPLIGPLTGANFDGIDWVIVGGESGNHLAEAERALKQGIDPCKVNPRWMHQKWARSIKDKCQRRGIAFFYKQDSGRKTEFRPYLQHSDGTYWEWHQFPNQLTPPKRVYPE